MPAPYPQQPVKLQHGTLVNHYTAASAILPTSIHGGTSWPIELVIWIDPSPFESIWMRDAGILLGCFVMFCAIATWGARQTKKQHQQHTEIREAARRLEHYQQERFLLATETANIGVWEYRLPDGLFEWNSSMKRMYGAEHMASRIPYAQWLSMVDEQDRPRVNTLMQRTGTQDSVFEYQFNIRRKSDGLLRNIQARAKLHRTNEEDQLRVVGIHIDITTQQQSELALQEAEERFRSAFQSAAIGMAMLSPSGMLTQVNAALCNWVGYDEAELLQMDYVSITHPEDAMLHWPTATEIGSDIRDDYQVEQRYIHKNGRVLWGLMAVSAVRDKTQKILHLIMQVQDITARKQHETALIEREHFLRTLSECLPGLVSYWSTDQLCHFANKNHEKFNGLSIDKMRGQHLRKVLGEETYEQHQHHIEGVLAGKQQRFERNDTQSTSKTVDMLVHLIPDILYGKVEGFFSISTNITDFKAQQRELQRINKELIDRTKQAEAANKAKGAFLANMSHEIRTPMNAIIGLLQLVEETPLTPTQRDYIRKTGGAAEVLLNVLNDILDISRVEANQLELSVARFNLEQLLSNSIGLFSYRADEKNIRIFYSKDESCPQSLLGDRLRLAQILNNLLSNAIKFTEKGHIHLHVQMTANTRQLEFRIQDTGIGMTEAQCQLLFKPFSQVDESPSRRYGGAGLGLSICKQLTELMQGTIWVKSQLAQGTTFHFTIPCLEPSYALTPTEHSAPPQETEATNTQPNHSVLQGQHILVVDDHPLNRMVASEMLTKWGAQVELANDGIQAVEACLKQTFQWVLMDLQMPEMDGFEATRIIRSKLGDKAPPIIALTASASETDRINLLEAGMCDQIIKPFKKSDLEKRLVNAFVSMENTP